METRPSKTGPGTPAIEFRNVSLSFGETQALKDVSFELWPGQMIVEAVSKMVWDGRWDAPTSTLCGPTLPLSQTIPSCAQQAPPASLLC